MNKIFSDYLYMSDRAESCSYFETPYKKITDRDTSNQKTYDGQIVIIMISLIILLVISSAICLFLFKSNKLYLYGLITSALIVFISLIIFVGLDPIRVAYAGSYLFTRNVRTEAILDPDIYFPGHIDFQNSFSEIRREVEDVMRYQSSVPLTRDTFNGENNYIGSDIQVGSDGKQKGWRFFMLTAGSDVSEAAKRLCPKTLELIQKHPQILSSGISILPGKVSIPQHVGYYKGILRYMLPIIVPKNRENVYICLNDQKLVWEEGVSVVFDDTYPHKVYNKTDETRVVLYMDIERKTDSLVTSFVHSIVSKLLLGSSLTKSEIKRTEVLQAINN